MSATLFHKITESFAGALFVGHSEGELLFLEQVAVREKTPAHLVDAMVRALLEMKALAGSTVAAPSHVVRFMGQVGIVTPYFEAMPLRVVQVGARAKRLSCPPGVALKIVLDIVDGLCQYHNLGTALSGGVCPDQILVGTDGDTRVGNVAVAAMPTKDSPWRANVDRLAYLAPEQASAQAHHDSHTDVYAVGVILWELLCNQPRFVASAARLLETLRSVNGPPQLAPLDPGRLAPAPWVCSLVSCSSAARSWRVARKLRRSSSVSPTGRCGFFAVPFEAKQHCSMSLLCPRNCHRNAFSVMLHEHR
jgi:serine/threonine protein kinase